MSGATVITMWSLHNCETIKKKKRGTLPLLILHSEVLEYLSYKNKQATPTPNMNATKQSRPQRTLCRRDIHIPKGVYCSLVLDRLKVSKFQNAKTSANKRFLYYVCKLLVCDCKGTTKKGHMQTIRELFSKIIASPSLKTSAER